MYYHAYFLFILILKILFSTYYLYLILEIESVLRPTKSRVTKPTVKVQKVGLILTVAQRFLNTDRAKNMMVDHLKQFIYLSPRDQMFGISVRLL